MSAVRIEPLQVFRTWLNADLLAQRIQRPLWISKLLILAISMLPVSRFRGCAETRCHYAFHAPDPEAPDNAHRTWQIDDFGAPRVRISLMRFAPGLRDGCQCLHPDSVGGRPNTRRTPVFPLTDWPVLPGARKAGRVPSSFTIIPGRLPMVAVATQGNRPGNRR